MQSHSAGSVVGVLTSREFWNPIGVDTGGVAASILMGCSQTLRDDEFPLTEEHRMLLRMRDTLYEGSWADFVRDLRARAEDRPHVFETVSASPQMKATIASHLTMIDQMQQWESAHGRTLTPEE